MIRCLDCGKIIPAAENKFKIPHAPGTAHLCNTCGVKRFAEEKPKKVVKGTTTE